MPQMDIVLQIIIHSMVEQKLHLLVVVVILMEIIGLPLLLDLEQ